MPGKRPKPSSKKPSKKITPKIDWPGHWLKLAGDPRRAVPTETCPEMVLGCIRQQSGGRDLSSNPKIGDVGVDGFILAGCINGKLNRNYTGKDFPPTMRILDVIAKVCD
jgi:hypothetical protein